MGDGDPLPVQGRPESNSCFACALRYRLLECKADWVVYVTDAGQAPHFELIFQAAKQAGWVSDKHVLTHCPFGLVCGEDGKKFKTRSGDGMQRTP